MTSTGAVATNRPAYPQATGTAAAFGDISSAIFGVLRWIAVTHARARTRRALRSLSDHALKDIGLTRSQIDSFEQDPRYRPHYARL